MERVEIDEVLFSKMCRMVRYYPEGAYRVKENIDSEGFFPVCNGLYSNESKEKIEILVVGHDFGNINYYKDIISNRRKDTNEPIFREIIRIFTRANVDLNKCFFTNSIIGLRKAGNMVGYYKAFEDKNFQDENVEFLLYTINAINPKVIITLGRCAHEMFCKLSKDILPWQDGIMKDANLGYSERIKIGNNERMFISIVHPYKRRLNISKRCYTEDNIRYHGNEAEIKMLSNISKVL